MAALYSASRARSLPARLRRARFAPGQFPAAAQQFGKQRRRWPSAPPPPPPPPSSLRGPALLMNAGAVRRRGGAGFLFLRARGIRARYGGWVCGEKSKTVWRVQEPESFDFSFLRGIYRFRQIHVLFFMYSCTEKEPSPRELINSIRRFGLTL